MNNFVAYKCTHSAIVLGGPSDINRGVNIISIDNHWGIAIHSGNDGKAELLDSTIYGEDEANKDCPEGSICDHCLSSTGITLNQACSTSHLDSQKKWFKHPLWKQCTSGMRAEATYTNVEFKDFTSGTKSCGSKMNTFAPWNGAADYVAFAEFKQATFDDTHQDAITFMRSPPQSWANWEDCGIDFTCTGLYNVVTRFENTRYTGDQNPGTPGTFNVLSNNIESDTTNIFEAQNSCEKKDKWNAYLCTDEYSTLIFDSLDSDRMDRSAQPIYIKTDEECNGSTCFNNRLNAFMDSCWDGFYTCQFREQRFPTMIKRGPDQYEVEYTGTPPIEQQFVLHGPTGSEGFIVKIKYSNGDRSYMIQDKDGNI